MSKRITDSDSGRGDEGIVHLHMGRGHIPYHPTPGPLPHPTPGPRQQLRTEEKRATGHRVIKTVTHGH